MAVPTSLPFSPSQLATPELVEAALVATSDPVLHANLTARLDTMKRLAKPGYDAFAGVVQADYSFDASF